MSVLVVAEHDNASLSPATLHTVTAATRLDGDIHLGVSRDSGDSALVRLSPAGELLAFRVLEELAEGFHFSKMIALPNGSVVDLVCWHEKAVTSTAINEVVRTAASTDKWREIIDYEDEPIVSSDIIRSPYSATFDSLATMVMGDRVSKTLAWYDSGWGYAHRVVDLINRFTEMEKEAA